MIAAPAEPAPEPRKDALYSGMVGSVAAVLVDEAIALTPAARLAGLVAAVTGCGVTFALEGGIMKTVLDTLGAAAPQIPPGHPESPNPSVVGASAPSTGVFDAPPEICWSPIADVVSCAGNMLGLHEHPGDTWGCGGIAGPISASSCMADDLAINDCGTGLDPGRAAYEAVLHGTPPVDICCSPHGPIGTEGDPPCAATDTSFEGTL